LAVVLGIVALLVLALLDGLRGHGKHRGEGERLSDEAVRNVTGRRKRDL